MPEFNIETDALVVGLVHFEDSRLALDDVEPFVRDENDLAWLTSPNAAANSRSPIVAEVVQRCGCIADASVPRKMVSTLMVGDEVRLSDLFGKPIWIGSISNSTDAKFEIISGPSL